MPSDSSPRSTSYMIPFVDDNFCDLVVIIGKKVSSPVVSAIASYNFAISHIIQFLINRPDVQMW